jgi:hypothetical protein
VLVRYSQHVRGARSGIEGELCAWYVARLRDGRFTEMRFYWTDEQQALKAFGLEE